MQTDDLILSLGGQASRISRGTLERRVAAGLAAGAVATLAILAMTLGFRPDLATAMHGFPFWMKWTYTLSLAIGAALATVHLSRPDTLDARWLWLLTIPTGLLALLAIGELVTTPQSGWHHLLFGHSWTKCSMLVAGLSVPIFAGFVWAFRQLAPSRLRVAGAVAGLASGASAATLYCFHCPEATATFVLVWYTLGMLTAAAIGALLGPRLLRW